ncbi:hypothetical protein CP532_5292 [Ophiocordyceps camponoti-leonardi (nom. inval.)]|nr:hypothetical protein CP532_5292 [Ophiocordyceps camponoti-leonardi (nom. inval.)]
MRGFAAVAVVMWFAAGVLAAPAPTTSEGQGSGIARPLVRRQSALEDAARKAGSQTSHSGRRRSVGMEGAAGKERREVEVEMLAPPPAAAAGGKHGRRSTESMTKEVVHHKAPE